MKSELRWVHAARSRTFIIIAQVQDLESNIKTIDAKALNNSALRDRARLLTEN
ncbi:hypothetical protein IQ249_16755 [Lusitaniella coriacea LEGE 07157]|uniref:Uncharacterized protein n=1 Tax=Lusitaniella coriacea LEGE 07157 TaxID=945747 RepID=A0A8J7JCD8_9CYAN|nr:hypothetical protein [Lusitaniella coriacea]MBE9117550.1 hypothetical protein [Lusitaniella coriacea LEGE 07157]